MKKTKKLLAMFIAVAMMFSLSIPSFANVGDLTSFSYNGVNVDTSAIAGVASGNANISAITVTTITLTTAQAAQTTTAPIADWDDGDNAGGALVAIPAADWTGAVTTAADGTTNNWNDILTVAGGITDATLGGAVTAGTRIAIQADDTGHWWFFNIAIFDPPIVVPPVGGPDYAGSGGTGGGSGSIEVLAHIIDVTLPSNTAFDFVLDPMGLMAIKAGEDALLSDLDGGKIVPKNDAAILMNQSSLPVVITMDLAFSGTDLIIVDDIDDVEDEDGALNALLYIVPSTGGVTELNADMGEDFDPNATAFAVGADSEMKFIFDAAAYEVKNTAGVFEMDLKDANVGWGTAFQVGGWVNSQGNWFGFDDDDVALAIVFTVSPVDDEGVDAAAGIFGFVSSDMEEVELDVEDTSCVICDGPCEKPLGFYNATTHAGISSFTIPAANAWFDIPFNSGGEAIDNATRNGGVALAKSTAATPTAHSWNDSKPGFVSVFLTATSARPIEVTVGTETFIIQLNP
jgi:hypothetical protein